MSVHTSTRGGVPHLADEREVPLPRSGREVPHPADGGYPLPRSGQGVPPSQAEGVPTWLGVPSQQGVPPPDQHSMYLLCGGQYASCVHTGGLSYYSLIVSLHLGGISHLYPVILPSTGPMPFLGDTPVPGPMSLPRGYPNPR